jgi:hypothetical protein
VIRKSLLALITTVFLLFATQKPMIGGKGDSELKPEFHTSDRCLACHNQLITPSGKDVSIGSAWRASVMANSSRDPYWQASVRRETIDHPEASEEIQDECSVCHMPVTRYEAKLRGEKGKIFDFLPFDEHKKDSAKAKDGVTCGICHQISKEKLSTPESFNGNFVVETPPSKDAHPEYGPFEVNAGHNRIMDSSTGGFQPTQAEHIRDSALCGSCHQLSTTARGAGGKAVGTFPEQMPYLEWLHSDYPSRASCQSCHMPEVHEATPISAVLGIPRVGLHEHTFVGGNFFLLRMLNKYRDELDTAALPQELTTAAAETETFLQSKSARVSLRNVDFVAERLQAEVFVENLTGHKLPTAYPSRRAWLHFVVRDRDGKVLFESGALNRDGSIAGNDNDADPEKFEPHYREITSGDQVQIYEPILKDVNGRVTTGLLRAVGYLKDDRLLPTGFDKDNVSADIAVVGDALDDPDFAAGGDVVRYSVAVGSGTGPFDVQVKLMYQPIGFRWAHNLAPYQAAEPQRFVNYYKAMSEGTATVLARTEVRE